MKTEKTIATTQLANLNTAAQIAAIEKVNAFFDDMKARAQSIKEDSIAVANDAVQIGVYMELATGKEQFELWEFTALQGLANDLTHKLATACVNLKRRRGAKFKFESLADAQQELDALFVGLNVLEPAKREKSAGISTVRVWGQWISTAFVPINHGLQELLCESPIDQWPTDRMETFLAQTQFIRDKHEQVEQMLGKTVTV